MATPVDVSAGSLSELSDVDQARVMEELRLSREFLKRQQEPASRIPHVPAFSGTTTKGFDYGYWKDLVSSIKGLYSEASIIQAIRKAVSGQPAQIIGNLSVDCTLTDIFTALDTAYDIIHDESAAWQQFYGANQTSKESMVDWHTRLCNIWARIPDHGVVGLKIKKRMWTGLYADAMKESSRHYYDNDDKSEMTMVKYLRQLEETKSSTNKFSTSSIQVDELQNQVAALTSKLESLTATRKNINQRQENQRSNSHPPPQFQPSPPQFEDQRLYSNDPNPQYNNRNPSYNNHNPSYNNRNPSYNNRNPSYNNRYSQNNDYRYPQHDNHDHDHEQHPPIAPQYSTPRQSDGYSHHQPRYTSNPRDRQGYQSNQSRGRPTQSLN